MSIKLRVTTLAASLMLATGAIYAQQGSYYDNDSSNNSYASDSNYASNAVDPPSRVARLSLLQGAVSFVPAGENDWIQAQANRPLITGDKLWTDRGARAELQIGPAAIRVDGQSSFNFLNLDDRTAQVELTQGTLNIRVRRLYEGQNYEIDTPTLAFVVNRVGEYRIDVAPDGRGTIVTAFRGGGDAYGEGGARFRIEEGQSVRFNDSALRDYESNSIPHPDDFDRFCFARDSRWENSPSRQYVSEDVIGYDDLDNYGSWSSEADYGNVWYPTSVAVGWTPYSYGHWGWVGAYGWTWVDDSPWGFAPFHYGRWAYIGGRWGWCPGPVHVRAYYAPALVAFIGGGGIRVGVGFNSGPVGWFPLGPRDVYVPGYRVSRDYFTRVNINNTTINNITVNNYYGNYSRGNFDYSRVNYANRNIAGAVTAVPGDVFVGARAIRGSALPVNRDTFASARVSGFAQIAPTRQSLAFEGGRRADAPPQAVLNRNIIAATRPPAPVASFAQREQVLQRDPGRALPVSQLRVTSGGEVAGRADARQDVRTQRGIAERPNVNVVTSTGMPARTPAPTIARDAQQGAAQQGAQDRGRTMRENAGAQDRAADNGPRNSRFNPNAVTPGQPSSQPSEREIRAGQVDRQSQQPDQRRVPRNETQEYRSAPVERAPQADAQQQRQVQQQQQQREQAQQQQRDMQQREQQQAQQRQEQQRAFQQQQSQQREQQQQQREQQQTQQREQQQRAFQQQQSQQREQQQQQQQMMQREQQQRAYQEQQRQAQQQQTQQREQQQQQQMMQREQQQRAYQEQQQRQVQQQQMQQREQQAQQRQQQQQQQQQQQPQQQQQGRRSRDKDQQDDRGHR